jgi:hypothetical protein
VSIYSQLRKKCLPAEIQLTDLTKIPCRIRIIDKLLFAYQVKKLSVFYIVENILPSLQDPDITLSPEATRFCLQLYCTLYFFLLYSL